MNEGEKTFVETDIVLKETVLVVDDQPGIRCLLTEVLTSNNYNVVLANNGYDGVQLSNELNPKAILLDMKMPGMSGIDALKEIKIKNKHGKIIVMTAYGEAELVNNVLVEGAFNYVTKPFDINNVSQIVADAIRAAEESLKSCPET